MKAAFFAVAAWTGNHMIVSVVAATLTIPVVLSLSALIVSRGRVVATLSRRLLCVRLAHPTWRLAGLHVSALTRARGGGSWSVELTFDRRDQARTSLGHGAPCEPELANAVVAWARRKAHELGIAADIVTGSDT